MSSEESTTNRIDSNSSASPDPVRCVKGCGFFGNSSTANMCSSCFKKYGGEVPVAHNGIVPPSHPSSDPTLATIKTAALEPVTPSSSTSETTTIPITPRKVQENKNRCWQCKKKVGFTGVECKCGYVFCGDHRVADSHNCDFDYKTRNKTLLVAAHPTITAAKLVEKL